MLAVYNSSKSSDGQDDPGLALLTGTEDSHVHFIFLVLCYFGQAASTLCMLK